MINENVLQLITAAVDGELTPLEVQRLRRVLDTSPQARKVYARLKADRARLQALPHVAPPADLHSRVMARVAAVTPAPARLAKSRTRTTASTPASPAPAPRKSLIARKWVPAAIAASLLLGVSFGSFLFFNQQGGKALARNPNRPPLATKAGAGDPEWAKWLPAESDPRPSVPVSRDHPGLPKNQLAVRPDTSAERLPIPQESVALAPEPRSVQRDLLGHAPLPETRFETADIRIPFLKPLREFEREDTRQHFAHELGRDPAFRVDLFARNPARAVELFRDAAKSTGVSVFADANALSQLQKRTTNAVVIYTESLTADELAALFGKLNAEDAKVSPHVFDVLHATPVSHLDTSDLRTTLGFDPGLFKRVALNEKLDRNPDPNKPISAGTADQIVKSVTTGQGKPGDKTAVLLNWNLVAGRQIAQGNSAELKQFRAKRGDRKPDAVPVIIVIRPGNG